MPTFGKKGKGESAPPKTVKKKKASGSSKKVKAPVTKELGEAKAPEVRVPTVRAFSDGVAAARLNHLVIVPHSGGEEVALLRSFLDCFRQSKCFVGNISTKMSFMKKGGRLI